MISSAGLGAIIWAMSPVMSGAIEPWDTESPNYFVSLFGAGAVVGLLQPKNIWAIYLGIVIGQLIYMTVFLASGPLIVIGIIFLIGYGLLSLLGAFLTSRLKRVAERTGSRGENGA